MAPEKAKALLAACYALLSGRLLKSATKGMRCYELTSCKLAVCIQIYSIQFTNTIQYFRKYHLQIHKIQIRPHMGWNVTLEVQLTVYLRFCERLLQYHINTTNITIFSSSVKISHLDYMWYSKSVLEGYFSPTGAHKAQDETLRAQGARLSARRRKSSAAPRLEWKGVAKGQRGLTLVGNIQARSSFTLPSIFQQGLKSPTPTSIPRLYWVHIVCSDIWIIWNSVKLTD